MQILTPIPSTALPGAARLWWAHFGVTGWRVPAMRADQGIVALDEAGRLLGVMGLRDASGGFSAAVPWLALLYRAAPATGDLVIDGIAVGRRRRGTGRALIAHTLAEARRRGHPGLRAEVRLANRPAMAFYARLGFVEVTRGRFGWPWGGQVAVLRLGAPPP